MSLSNQDQLVIAMFRKAAEKYAPQADWNFIEAQIVTAGGVHKAQGYAKEMTLRIARAAAADKADNVEKAATMKTEDGQQYPAAAFAYVPDAEMPSTWKLRLWDSPDAKETRRQVGMAVAALGKGFRGNKVQIPAEDMGGVKAKVKAAWKKVNPDLTDDDMPGILKG
jgi:hypothetical protein